jgi:hypothetical protein
MADIERMAHDTKRGEGEALLSTYREGGKWLTRGPLYGYVPTAKGERIEHLAMFVRSATDSEIRKVKGEE